MSSGKGQGKPDDSMKTSAGEGQSPWRVSQTLGEKLCRMVIREVEASDTEKLTRERIRQNPMDLIIIKSLVTGDHR